MQTVAIRMIVAVMIHLWIFITACAEERRFVTSSRLSLGIENNLSASVHIGDVDGDSDLDVVVANGRHWPQQNYLFLNQGRARFSVVRNLGTERAPSYATELADLDGDGDLDLAVGNDMARNLIFLNDGSGLFQVHSTFGGISSVRSLTLADLDGDKDIDIVMTCRGRKNQIFLNNGEAEFDSGQEFGTVKDSTIDVAVADFNQDGHPDLVLANRDNQQNEVLLNRGHVQFSGRVPFGTGNDETRAVAVSDLDGDGKLDLLAGNIGAPNVIYFGDGSGGIRRTTSFGRPDGKTYALRVRDMDNDGHKDLVAANVGQHNTVFFNQGNGVDYREVGFGNESDVTYGIAIGDLNGDGYQDIAVAQSGAMNAVFLNLPSKN